MTNEEFEWDDDKAAANARKHGVTFEEARGVFRDPWAIELVDDREAYGEDRFVLIGMTQSRPGARRRLCSSRTEKQDHLGSKGRTE